MVFLPGLEVVAFYWGTSILAYDHCRYELQRPRICSGLKTSIKSFSVTLMLKLVTKELDHSGMIVHISFPKKQIASITRLFARAGLLEETPKKVPDQLLVCEIGDHWRFWMVYNWSWMIRGITWTHIQSVWNHSGPLEVLILAAYNGAPKVF